MPRSNLRLTRLHPSKGCGTLDCIGPAGLYEIKHAAPPQARPIQPLDGACSGALRNFGWSPATRSGNAWRAPIRSGEGGEE
jgi:hypothetical protein